MQKLTAQLEKSRLRERGQTEPGLVAFYDIRPGKRVGLFLQPGVRTGLHCILKTQTVIIYLS